MSRVNSLNIKKAERAIRDICRNLEIEEGVIVSGIQVVEIDPEGLLGLNIDHGVNIKIEITRLPGRMWMKD